MYIDIVLLGIIILFTVLGIKKGLIFEFFSLFGILVAVLLSKKVINIISPTLEAKFGESQIGFIITYVGVFIGIYIILFLILLVVKKFFEKILLGWIDRLGGGIVGFLKGFVISLVIMIIVTLISNFNNEWRNYIQKSYSSKVIAKVIPYLKSFFPSDININMQEFTDDTLIKGTLEDVLKDTNSNLNIEEIQEKINKKTESENLNRLKSGSKKINIKDLQEKIKKKSESKNKGEKVDIDELLDTVLEEYNNEDN
ncbi:MAG: CvpA family protein [Fusobacteriota bacterium]